MEKTYKTINGSYTKPNKDKLNITMRMSVCEIE